MANRGKGGKRWQQQAINQLTVQKNCRKLLDIYGQRTHKEKVIGYVNDANDDDDGDDDANDEDDKDVPVPRPASIVQQVLLASMTLKDSNIVSHNYKCSIFECATCRISNKQSPAQWDNNNDYYEELSLYLFLDMLNYSEDYY